MEALRTADEIRDVNTRYHDVAAASYDAKWGIDFGDVGQAQVLGKMRKLLGDELQHGYARGLEIGSGTGYFSLNLLQASILGEATCTDISPEMVATLAGNARRLGLEVRAARADAESLPFADASFDLAFGHAVLHHLPDLPRAFAELHRVLRPGGRIVFAGEPSRIGDRLAAVPKRGASLLAPGWRALLRLSPASAPGDSDVRAAADHALEDRVDVHAFAPGDLSELARRSGFEGVHVRGEELLANWFGWLNRGLETTAEPSEIPRMWINYAYHGYLLLQRVDERLLEPYLPPAIFYNLLLTARKPR
ncbi:MAG: class I SAM-dependent methyltransferase [Actinomycetota bacterium]|nr:class I SAM-dependent methyltransferase [Actinomycetota bacterium]